MVAGYCCGQEVFPVQKRLTEDTSAAESQCCKEDAQGCPLCFPWCFFEASFAQSVLEASELFSKQS